MIQFADPLEDPRLAITPEEWAEIARRLDIPPRQVQIAQAFMAGYSKRETIAHLLGIEPCSVKTHTERLYRHLGVHSNIGVIVRVFAELLNLRGLDSAP